MQWNCNSINNKQEEFKTFLNKNKPDIMLLNETKINDFNANVIFNQLNEFNFIHKQRNFHNGAGGVAIIINKNINYSQISVFDSLNLEIL